MAPTAPRFHHHDGPVLGIGTPAPRISWTIPAAEPDYAQRSYRLEVRVGDGEPQVTTVESADQVLVPWPSAPLEARESVTVRVRVRAKDWSPWSEPAQAEAGLIAPSDWLARFISPVGLGGLRQPAPELRGVIGVPGRVAKARLFATAHGLLNARLNGHRVDDTVLAPGWTSYEHRLRYRAYDVTSLIKEGDNALEVIDGTQARGRSIPLVGRVTAGQPILAIENIEDYLVLPQSLVGLDELFCLRVQGESMIGAGIFDGDILVVRRQETAENGEIVVAMIDDEATVKRIYYEDGRVRLQPENPTMEPIYADEVTVLGKVTDLFRHMG